MNTILIVDDERAIRRAMREILEFEDYEVVEASDGKEALDMLRKRVFDVIFCDIKMPKMDGSEFLLKSREICNTPVIMISGHGTIATAVECLKNGAVDYIEKPLDLNRILSVVKEQLQKAKSNLPTMQKQVAKRTKQVQISSSTVIIGQSQKVKQMLALIDKVAPTDAKVLITGDNGTGKELVAKMLHEKSLRSKNPFVELNCAAIPNELIESELFGHEKGSFTSAIAKQKGKFQLADTGTLFLDEIGDMSLNAQSKVLQAIQEKKILPVGSEKEIQVDVRILSATNKNLREEIEAGRFREDLYHRMNVIEIKVPALNERREDIPLLVDYFLEQIAAETSSEKSVIEKPAMAFLQDFDYKGNIRQLRNIVERLIILSDKVITLNDVKNYL
ncbi:MAG: sigma-54-dependent Fis family transcriptional regulator [Bacteroidales bacterium]|nr:sigma-54-dependent Fis family transcriptional regulator [Bacteroidales bacterium]